MEPRAVDTMPLPVVETVASPAAPEATTVALPVEPAPRPPHRRRDLTPLVLGLLVVAAIAALGLSALALSRRGSAATPGDPAGAQTVTTAPTVAGPEKTGVYGATDN